MTIAKKHNAVPNSNPPSQVMDGYLLRIRLPTLKIDHLPRGIPAQIVRDARGHGLRFMSASDVLFRS